MSEQIRTKLSPIKVSPDNMKKSYRRPTLTRHGDVRTMTLAPSPVPQTESGGGGTFGRFILP